jgi:hypothetical protein
LSGTVSGRPLFEFEPINPYAAIYLGDQTDDGSEQGGFSDAIPADEGTDTSSMDAELKTMEYRTAAVTQV